MFCLLPFLNIGKMFLFIQSSGNIKQFKPAVNIVRSDSVTESLDIFNIWILIASWSWALLGSSLQIIIFMSSFVNYTLDRYWSVMGLVEQGRTLLFSKIEHCFEKKKIKKVVFFLKICNKFLVINNSQDVKEFLCPLTTNNILKRWLFYALMLRTKLY